MPNTHLKVGYHGGSKVCVTGRRHCALRSCVSFIHHTQSKHPQTRLFYWYAIGRQWDTLEDVSATHAAAIVRRCGPEVLQEAAVVELMPTREAEAVIGREYDQTNGTLWWFFGVGVGHRPRNGRVGALIAQLQERCATRCGYPSAPPRPPMAPPRVRCGPSMARCGPCWGPCWIVVIRPAGIRNERL